MARKGKKKVPAFPSAQAEARFWETHSTVDFWDDTDEVLEDLTFAGDLARRVEARRQRKRQLTIRLEQRQIDAARAIAASKGIGYQTLLRMWIIEGIRRDFARKETASPQST